MYVSPVAPGMSAHVRTPLGQRCQRRASAIGAVPFQVPALEPSVAPCLASPLIAGGTELTGPAATTTAVGSESADTVPAELDAVSRTTTAWPTSPAVRR